MVVVVAYFGEAIPKIFGTLWDSSIVLLKSSNPRFIYEGLVQRKVVCKVISSYYSCYHEL